MQQTDELADSTETADTPVGPSRASIFFVVALIMTAVVFAGLLLWAAFGDQA